ncbi:MAG: MerR family transcriptional regulator [Chloroflexi bacterium]|nr:MerR family transcriptional regulator [Chloroflexota bacterium]
MNEAIPIQKVTQQTGLTIHTLRYYERIGLIQPVHRADNGHRRYTENDINWIIFLTRLRTTGMSINDMQTYTNLVRAGESTVCQRKAMLEAHKQTVEEKIAALQDNLEIIKTKIGFYEDIDNSCEPNSV